MYDLIDVRTQKKIEPLERNSILKYTIIILIIRNSLVAF